jgi:hypothetical protein
MWWLYVGTGLTVLFLVIVRGLTAGQRPERHQLAGGRPARPPRIVPVASPAARESVEQAG